MTKLRATTSFTAPGRRRIDRGEVVDSADPIVRGREHFFEPAKKRAAKKAAATAEASPQGD